MAGDPVPAERLLGWKSIAAFLGVDARTAKRWEGARGLPVHRLPGAGPATVWASAGELRAWLEPPGTLAPPPPAPPPAAAARRRRWWPLAAAAVAIAGATIGTAQLVGTLGTPAPAAAYADDPAAQRQWQAARFALATRSADGIEQAERAFTALTQRFPDRAPAYAGLAEAHFLSREFGAVPDSVAFPAASRAARAALALDPTLADAWLDTAFVDFWWSHDLAGGLAAFRQAVARAPDDAKAHHWFATAASAIGDAATARTEIARALALDPGNHAIVADAAYVELEAGNVAGARAALIEFVRADPGFVSGHRYLALADLVAGDNAGYLDEEATMLRLQGKTAGLAALDAAHDALATGGRAAMLDRLTTAAAAAAAEGTGTAAAVARLRAQARDRAGLLHWLAVSQAHHEWDAVYIIDDPELLPWRHDPAVRAFGHHT